MADRQEINTKTTKCSWDALGKEPSSNFISLYNCLLGGMFFTFDLRVR